MTSLGRVVEPEWLDSLSAIDPQAQSSRRDLARLNAIMLQPRLMSRLLRESAFSEAPKVIMDLGSGDGLFMLRLASILSRQWSGVSVVLVDRQASWSPEIRGRFAQLGWMVELVVADVFDALEDRQAGRTDVVLTNLFLHHLPSSRLARLFSLLAQRTNLFAACEPRRSRLALVGSNLVGLLGCNGITRHDAPASVRAGFCDAELSALWPKNIGWTLTERSAGLFSHGFVARHVC